MKNSLLWLVLGLLLVVFIGSKFLNKPPQRSFNADFIEMETKLVDKIAVYPKAGQESGFSLEQKNGEWHVISGDVDAIAMDATVESMLESVDNIKAKRVVAKSEDKWASYEVESDNAKRIEFYSGGKKVEELVFGRFDFNQQTRSAKSYMRHQDDVNVYEVDGFLSMTMAQSADAFRNNQILKTSSSDVKSIKASINGESITLRKENYWIDEKNKMIDSTAIKAYISNLTSVVGTAFENNFSPESSEALGSLVFEFINENDPITIKAYRSENAPQPYVIQSSSNPASFFKSDSAGVYKTLFLDLLSVQ